MTLLELLRHAADNARLLATGAEREAYLREETQLRAAAARLEAALRSRGGPVLAAMRRLNEGT